MKVVLQRVAKAKVTVEDENIGKIGPGYLLLVGIGEEDDEDAAEKMAQDILKLRVMADDNGKMNKSIVDVSGEILVVSQFTLYADTSAGNRPSFINAADAKKAERLYDYFVEQLREKSNLKIATGEFGAFMEVSLVNDGPVTILLDNQQPQW